MHTLKQEIRTRYSRYDEIDATSALQLSYLQATISEGLRIYPPGSQGFPRISTGLEIDGTYIPAGVSNTFSLPFSISLPIYLSLPHINYTHDPIFIPRSSINRFINQKLIRIRLQQAEIYTSAWTVTHDARNFHSPYAFKPERWLDKECADIKEASQPFSLGPRGCLGRK